MLKNSQMDKTERIIHTIFNISIILKGLHALFEIIVGILVFFVSKENMVSFLFNLTQDKLYEYPPDPILNFIYQSISNLSADTQHFMGWYLLWHGVVKIIPVYGLLRQQLWAYPVAMVILVIFIIYQIYRYFFTYSGWLIFFSIVDVFVLYLVIHEYRYIKKHLNLS